MKGGEKMKVQELTKQLLNTKDWIYSDEFDDSITHEIQLHVNLTSWYDFHITDVIDYIKDKLDKYVIKMEIPDDFKITFEMINELVEHDRHTEQDDIFTDYDKDSDSTEMCDEIFNEIFESKYVHSDGIDVSHNEITGIKIDYRQYLK